MAQNSPNALLRIVRRLAVPSSATGEDAALVVRFATYGDEAAFAELVRRHGPMVRAACRRVLRDQHLADDACQAAFLVLARKARSLRQPDRLAGWLHGVAYRTALNARSRRRRVVGPERPLEEAAMPAAGHDADWADLRPVLDEEVRRLPDRYREA